MGHRGAVAALLVGGLLVVGPAAAQEPREPLDVEVFTRIGSPGMPEGIAVDLDGTVYVSTHNHNSGDADEPSRIFAYTPDGELLREYVVEGQPDGGDGGLLGMGFDADGLLYVIDRAPPRILTLDPATGAQADYASFRTVPPCDQGGEPGDCKATVSDLATFPDDLVFAPDGTMYVTDLEQALVWRVPSGGGDAEVWFTDQRLESTFGPNGIRLLPDGETLLFNMTTSLPPDAGTGKIYRLLVGEGGSPGDLDLFWEGLPADGPDNLALAASGNVYVALAGANQVLVLSPAGEELARVPETPLHNQLQEIPFDLPAGIAFLEDRVLVANQSYFTENPDTWAVLDVFAGEPGMPLFRPQVAAAEIDPAPTAEPGPPAPQPTLPATGGTYVGLAALALLLVALSRLPRGAARPSSRSTSRGGT